MMINEPHDFRHDESNRKFTMKVGDEIAFVSYHMDGETMYLDYSEVPVSLRGHGIGRIVVEKTFEYIEEKGIQAVAICSFIWRVAQRNERWKDIIS